MNAELRALIEEFTATVARRFAQLRREESVPSPKSRVEWATNDMKKKGTLSDGASYSKHGAGVRIESESDLVDFDFGDQGEVDGFDAWRLSEFASARLARYSLSSVKQIQGLIDAALAAGDIQRRGPLYYLR